MDDVRTKIFLHLFTSNLETENFETESLSLTGVNETSAEKGLREICAQAGFKRYPMTVSENVDPCSIWPEIRHLASADV